MSKHHLSKPIVIQQSKVYFPEELDRSIGRKKILEAELNCALHKVRVELSAKKMLLVDNRVVTK